MITMHNSTSATAAACTSVLDNALDNVTQLDHSMKWSFSGPQAGRTQLPAPLPHWIRHTHRILHRPTVPYPFRSKRCGFCPPVIPNFSEQLEDCNHRLFNRIRHNPQHVLPSAATICCLSKQGLWPRRHDRQLPAHISRLMDCQFLCAPCTKTSINARYYNFFYKSCSMCGLSQVLVKTQWWCETQ